MTKLLTVSQLDKAMQGKKYVMLRLHNGYEYAVNAGMSPIALRRNPRRPTDKTRVVSLRECGLHEYISNKHPFL